MSEGGRGVIPMANAIGVIPRLYFMRPSHVLGVSCVALCASENDSETVRLGKGWLGVITCPRALRPVTLGFVIRGERLICEMIF